MRPGLDLPPERLGARRRWWILADLGLAQLMVVLDGTIVNIALPSAQRELGFSTTDRQWVITAYSLAFASLLLLGGRLADRIGRRRIFLIGLIGFAIASAVGGSAATFGILLAARAVQGAFAALLAPAALSLLTTTFTEPAERSKAFGVFGAVAGSGAAIGLLLGGGLTEYLSWRWCLYVNLAIAAIAFAIGMIVLERDRIRPSAPLDIPGTVTVSGGLFMVVFGFAHAETAGWLNPLTITYLAVGVALLVVFVALQHRVPHPLLPLRVILDRNRAGGYLATFVVAIGLFGVLLFLTYYLQAIEGFSAVRSGVAFLPMSAAIVLASFVGSTFLTPRVSPRIMLPLGMLTAAGGMALFTRIHVAGSYVGQVLPASLVLGVGLGAVFGFASNTGTSRVRAEDAGIASALVSTSQQVGASIGTALLNTLANSATAAYLAGHSGPAKLVQAHAAVHGYVTGFWVAAAILAAGAIAVLGLLRNGILAGPSVPVP
jgi:EmrB/QacA subfamily drug resistance transporter